MSGDTEVKSKDIQQLLKYFSRNTYKARDNHPQVQQVVQRCLALFEQDYQYSVLPNGSGELSTNYPSSLVILESEKNENENGHDESESTGRFCTKSSSPVSGNGSIAKDPMSSTTSSPGSEGNLDPAKLKDLCSRARFARCRARFPVPVILYNKKHICRSATLSGGPEIYGRSSFDYFFSGGTDSKVQQSESDVVEDGEILVTETQSDWQLFDRVRSQDIRLLKAFQVDTIVDLMVEKKKVKFGVNVTSSEKVDKENRYADFKLISLPYPGCEFFKQYRDNGYNGEELVFEWNQTHVDANIFVPPDMTTPGLQLDWSHYRAWDLVILTQNYLKLLLSYLRDGRNGLLVHCISGWDRTPLFISLLRLSLWADGAIHKSLNAEQILYLTLAYDWLLFGHNLEDRLSKGEEILFFCFYFLKYMVDHDFSVDQETTEKVNKTFPLCRVRNDSDIQLDGILLDGDGSHTSPGGSNWSLNSCGSSLSARSQDNNPPVYFQVPQDTWDDCPLPVSNGQSQCPAHHPHNHSMTMSDLALTPTPTNGTTANGHNGAVNCSCSNGTNGQLESVVPVQNAIDETEKLGIGRTSPVAVPVPNRSQHRPESDSSASIGSWQMITGPSSLRDTASSSSDPGSNSSRSKSHPISTVGTIGTDFIETSESSCTLIDELTDSCSQSINGGVDEGTPRSDWKMVSDTGEDDDDTPRSEDSVFVVGQTNGSTSVFVTPPGQEVFMSRRRERLQTVRAHFYSLYASSIGFQFRSVHDNGGSSGLGFLIGNFATKVGIRTPYRNNL